MRTIDAQRQPYGKSQRLLYQLFLPIGVLVNLGLGILIISGLKPLGWLGWLEVGAGVFCCLVSGWISASVWSTVYWQRTMSRQVAVWRQIADAFFTWVDDVQLPAETVHRLKTSLDKVVPTSQTN